jgi:glucose/arabinose dehydrogenase
MTSSRRRLVATTAILVGLAVLAVTLAGRGAGNRAHAGATGLALDQIGTFEAPVYVDNAPGKKKLLFVVEQPGTIRVLRNGRKLSRPFLDITDRVQYGGEEGLLSIAFHPKFKKNRRFFVYYNNNDGDIQVDRFKTRKKKRRLANPKSRTKVLKIDHPGQANHNGGQLQFGPDRLLYVGTGDGGGQGDPGDNAQDTGSLLGKLLRIKPRPHRGYKAPRSNPLVGEAGRDEIYALGLRNPFRFSFDSKTGDLSIGDVGGVAQEEIDHEPLAAAKGANFGWDCREGNLGGPSPSPACPGSGFTAPIHTYPRIPGGAVIGGYVVRDSSLSGFVGRYLYTDLASGDIRSLDPDAADVDDTSTGLEVSAPSSFGEGRGNKLYVASLGDDAVYRIAPD